MTRHLVLATGLVGVLAVPLIAQDAPVQTGKDLYASHRCARCHRIGDKGYKENKLDGIGAKMSAEDMRRWLTAPKEMEAKLEKKPKVKMSSRKNMTLDDREVNALVAYLKTLK